MISRALIEVASSSTLPNDWDDRKWPWALVVGGALEGLSVVALFELRRAPAVRDPSANLLLLGSAFAGLLLIVLAVRGMRSRRRSEK
jgi:hypothetical protein